MRLNNISRGSLAELEGDVEDCKEDALINETEFDELSQLIQSADILSSKYLNSLYKMEKAGTWKTPGCRTK